MINRLTTINMINRLTTMQPLKNPDPWFSLSLHNFLLQNDFQSCHHRRGFPHFPCSFSCSQVWCRCLFTVRTSGRRWINPSASLSTNTSHISLKVNRNVLFIRLFYFSNRPSVCWCFYLLGCGCTDKIWYMSALVWHNVLVPTMNIEF